MYLFCYKIVLAESCMLTEHNITPLTNEITKLLLHVYTCVNLSLNFLTWKIFFFPFLPSISHPDLYVYHRYRLLTVLSTCWIFENHRVLMCPQTKYLLHDLYLHVQYCINSQRLVKISQSKNACRISLNIIQDWGSRK